VEAKYGIHRRIIRRTFTAIIYNFILGSLIGNIKIKGLSLGTAGVLLIAMVFGHFGYQVSPVVQNLGLSMFITAVGLQAGPRFFRMMRTRGVVFGIIAVIIVFAAVITAIIVSKAFQLSDALSVGVMTGALTSTPGLAAGLQATNDPLTSVGYGIAYPFGVIAIVLFVQLVPRLTKKDLMEDMNQANNPVKNKHAPEVITVEITNPDLNKKKLSEVKFPNLSTVVISRVIRDKRTIIALSDTVLLLGDKLVGVGSHDEMGAFSNFVGKVVDVPFENTDHIQLRKVTVDSEDIIGKNIKELRLRRDYGVSVTRIERGGIEMNQNPNMRLIRGDVLTIVSSEDRLEQVEKLFARKKLAVTNVDIFSFSLILLIGILVGMIPIPIPGLGAITLGVAGGPLFVALIIGHFGKIGPIHARYFNPSNQVIRDIGLVLFLAGAGTTAGQGLVEVIQSEGLRLVFGGMLITMVPIIVGYMISRKIFKLSIIHSLGVLCGGMTSTPGLGAVNQVVDSEDPAIAYAAAYPFALILVAISTQLVAFFL